MSNENNSKPSGLLSVLTEVHPAANGISTPPPSSPFLNFFNRPVARGLYYNGKSVPLDGYQFVECRFDNCTLLVASTNFELVDCVIDEKTVIQYGTEAIKIVHLFNSRSAWWYENASFLAPRKNPNGTITINGLSR